MIFTDDELKEARKIIHRGEFLPVERIAQNVEMPEEIRKEAGMKEIEASINSRRWSNLLYIMGSKRFLDEVKLAAGAELVGMGMYLELIALGERYPEQIRTDAGRKLVERHEAEGRMGALERIADRRGWPQPAKEMARKALDLLEMKGRRREALRNMKRPEPLKGQMAPAKTKA